MPFIPHTDAEIRDMLATIGAGSIDALFDEIPQELRCDGLSQIPDGVPEMEIARIMRTRARRDGSLLSFCGAGAYEHHIPAAVWEIATRGEFYSAYTPYQAEASQGTLQLLYEYQSMICALTGMEVSNASLYDGATALAEALLMAVRANGNNSSRRVLMPRTVHPLYRSTVRAITEAQGIDLVNLDYDPQRGVTPLSALQAHEGGGGDVAAVVVPQPNFFGGFEDVDALTDWAHTHGALAVALVNPVSLAVLKPPGEWGGAGADIACGEGQPLGVPPSSGGPYFGFLTAKQALVRQMPGRIVGRTVDSDGRPGFTLTLQAREQHIRRSKATSNICTNQGLMVTAATIHMALLGADGLARVAQSCMAHLQALVAQLLQVKEVEAVFAGPQFHEAVLRLPRPVAPVLARLADEGILGGYDISGHYPELGNALLVCATETRTNDDFLRYADALRRALNS
jgi:glycine dehydrogenase subunit 1